MRGSLENTSAALLGPVHCRLTAARGSEGLGWDTVGQAVMARPLTQHILSIYSAYTRHILGIYSAYTWHILDIYSACTRLIIGI